MSDAQDVARTDRFRLVSKRRDAAVDFGKFGVCRLETEIAQRLAQRVSSRVLAHYQRTRRHAHRFRRNDFVGQGILDDAVLMDSRFVSKCICADDGFVRCDNRTSDLREQAAGWKELVQFDVGGHAETFLAHSKCYRDFFQRSVTGSFANSVYGALNLANTGANGCE